MSTPISYPHRFQHVQEPRGGRCRDLAHQRGLNPGKHCPCGASAMLMADRGVCCGRYAAARAAYHASAAAGGWLGTCLATHAGTRGRHGGQAFACACQPKNMQHEAPWRVFERSQLSHVACLARASSLAWRCCWHALARADGCRRGPEREKEEEVASRLLACTPVGLRPKLRGQEQFVLSPRQKNSQQPTSNEAGSWCPRCERSRAGPRRAQHQRAAGAGLQPRALRWAPTAWVL